MDLLTILQGADAPILVLVFGYLYHMERKRSADLACKLEEQSHKNVEMFKELFLQAQEGSL